MMRVISILIIVNIISSCVNKPDKEIFNCSKGEMRSAWYEHGKDEPIPSVKGLKKEFQILVDTNLKANNFISFDEEYFRKSEHKDMSDFNWIKGWDKLTENQKIEKTRLQKAADKDKADSIHLINNNGQQQVWIINNSKDTVVIQMQDWLFICVLQALTKGNHWYPIQYWRFSGCGNSYHYKYFLPKTANSFITDLPKKGDYKTKLRYKLLGKDKYYYSNEFEGSINYCRFVEDTSRYENRFGKKQPHFKLDSLINLRN